MNIKISTGNYDVIDSGTVINIVNETIEFVISDLTYVIEFRNDSEKANNPVEKEVINNRSLRLVFYNYNNSLGTGNLNPVAIGTIKGRRLFISYRVYALSDNSGKAFHYTFLLEKEVTNEQ